ncbi:MAG TPA: site-specific integrase [Roseiarcus sp.]|nr:site-specific integrase [Roseiarcus sp.]
MRRFLGEGRYEEGGIGKADDFEVADEKTVLSFDGAQDIARRKARAAEHAELGIQPAAGRYTVADAIRDYFEAREHRGSKGVKGDRRSTEARILPELGPKRVDRLTASIIRSWHAGLAKAPKRLRTKATAERQATRAIDANDAEAVRARRATANRVLTILKAALNHAYGDDRIASDEAWRKVKPFPEVDTPVVRFLTTDECQRLINACDKSFSSLVRGALLTGCRYGELIRMEAADFNRESATITVRLSKAGKPRHVVLTDEGGELFEALTAGRASRELIFRREDGGAWGKSHQARPIADASARAKIEPPATFHILRHTYASALAMHGAPMGVIAAQLGHADTRMTEKHYAHLAPSYVADTVRAALPALGIVERSNIASLARR